MPRFQATRDYLDHVQPIGGPGCIGAFWIFCVVVALVITGITMHAIHHPFVAPLIHFFLIPFGQ